MTSLFDGIRTFFRGATTPGDGLPGHSTSGNGASSFHLWWRMAPEDRFFTEVSATLEIVEPPQVNSLYFWALQVNFHNGERQRGGAHTGLQWNAAFPNNRAVNWGGYNQHGGIFEGEPLRIPSTPRDKNTGDYNWELNVKYRFTVRRSENGWLSSVTNLSTNVETAIREIYDESKYLCEPLVWSEVFARFDDPGVIAHWSDLTARILSGQDVKPRSLGVSYQSRENGGAMNTNATVIRDANGGLVAVQTTNVERTTPNNADLPWK